MAARVMNIKVWLKKKGFDLEEDQNIKINLCTWVMKKRKNATKRRERKAILNMKLWSMNMNVSDVASSSVVAVGYW